MKTRHTTPSSLTATVAVIPTTYPKVSAISYETQPELAPDWMLKAMRWQVLNSPAEWQLSSKVCKLVDQGGITMAEALLMQQHIQQEIEKQDVLERQRLCRLILQTIDDYPELFQQKWYGRSYVDDALCTLKHKGHSWKALAEAYDRLETIVDAWKKTKHLIEIALVDGTKIASDIRKASRDPKHTHANDRATAQRLAAKLFGPESESISNYGALTVVEKLYELLLDSTQQADLVRAMHMAVA